jgi:glycosyltransferase involved in cell wall biosynthesis
LPPAITCLVTAHREGLLAHLSLRSIRRAVDAAQAAGLDAEILVVLDRADAETERVVRTHPDLRPQDRVIEADVGDAGLARNLGVAQSHGQCVSIFDADDHFSSNWLAAAHLRVQQAPQPVVVHPELMVEFGTARAVVSVIDQLRHDYPLVGCLTIHPWIGSVFARRDVFERFPYSATRAAITGFGFEDWHWNLEVICGGYLHTTAPQTALFYRRKPSGSRQDTERAEQPLLKPSRFFGPGSPALRDAAPAMEGA